ncbi:MAG: prepilin-type N-terminal cleavage/methylation domain-containing protein [Candidatus Eisenbacteria bacterium]
MARGRIPTAERGVTLVELLAALMVISIGVLALVRLFPTGARNQVEDRLMTSANLYAQEKLEELGSASWTGTALTVGRHPAGTATESIGANNTWQRYYEVEAMAIPLDNLKKITVTVTWNFMGARSVTATTYQRR